MSKSLTNHKKPLSMTSQEIAQLTGKRHDNVVRDIQNMVAELYGLAGDPSKLRNQLKQHVTKAEFDNRGYISLIELNEELTLTLTSGYSVLQRNAIIKRWQELEAKNQLALPANYIEALECLVISEKEKNRLIQDNQKLVAQNKETITNFNAAMSTVKNMGDVLAYQARVLEARNEDREDLEKTYRSA
jgi:phage regulator Rha-like protein